MAWWSPYLRITVASVLFVSLLGDVIMEIAHGAYTLGAMHMEHMETRQSSHNGTGTLANTTSRAHVSVSLTSTSPAAGDGDADGFAAKQPPRHEQVFGPESWPATRQSIVRGREERWLVSPDPHRPANTTTLAHECRPARDEHKTEGLRVVSDPSQEPDVEIIADRLVKANLQYQPTNGTWALMEPGWGGKDRFQMCRRFRDEIHWRRSCSHGSKLGDSQQSQQSLQAIATRHRVPPGATACHYAPLRATLVAPRPDLVAPTSSSVQHRSLTLRCCATPPLHSNRPMPMPLHARSESASPTRTRVVDVRRAPVRGQAPLCVHRRR